MGRQVVIIRQHTATTTERAFYHTKLGIRKSHLNHETILSEVSLLFVLVLSLMAGASIWASRRHRLLASISSPSSDRGLHFPALAVLVLIMADHGRVHCFAASSPGVHRVESNAQ